jgi:hypothetical protein
VGRYCEIPKLGIPSIAKDTESLSILTIICMSNIYTIKTLF